MLEALADDAHPDHHRYLDRVPEGFDPAVFDQAAVDRRLAALSRRFTVAADDSDDEPLTH